MSVTPDNTSADPEQLIADLRLRLVDRAAEGLSVAMPPA